MIDKRGASAGGTGQPNGINCPKCKFFYVTWDPSFPRGCRLYGFKTATSPSYMVREATGKPCPHFSPKSGR
jgi:hypothetical protein